VVATAFDLYRGGYILRIYFGGVYLMKHVHLIGIGGTGLSAIAQVLLEQGFTVSGSDREVSPLFNAVSAQGAHTFLGHDPENVTGAQLVIRSSAIPDDNPEVTAALGQGIPVLKRRDFLKELTKGKHTLAVAGSHGKTTTTAMLIWILHCLDQDPSFISGGVISQLARNAHAGTGRYFVIEADEYDHMFLGLAPTIAIITNIEHDHPDCFPTSDEYHAAFQAFLERVLPDGKTLLCFDDAETRALFTQQNSQHLQLLGYGTSTDANYIADNIVLSDGFYQFDLTYQHGNGWQKHLGRVSLKVPGRHNILNATAALAVIHQLDFSLPGAIQAIGEFSGTGRRFEILGTADGVTIIDDYGHHPSEIAATLEAAQSRYPGRRIWAIWQPHTYTRTQNLAQGFTQALDLAEKVLVLKIYAARETDPGYSAEVIALALPPGKASYAPDFDLAAEHLINNLASGDIAIIFSAGDATQLSQMVVSKLRQRERES
jgi:UDP-N-acetylmuramate--alanine ligase